MSFGDVHPGIDSPSHPRGFPRDRDQPHSHRSPVVRGKRHVRAIVEEDPNAAVGELVAKAILVGIIHPLAHPHKVLMAGQGSWVFLCCWRREEVSSAASQPLSISPPQGEQIPTAGTIQGAICTPSSSHAFIPWGRGCTAPYLIPEQCNQFTWRHGREAGPQEPDS